MGLESLTGRGFEVFEVLSHTAFETLESPCD